MRYVVHAKHLELVARDIYEAHDFYASLQRCARRSPTDDLVNFQARTARITPEWLYLLTRSIPLLALSALIGALLAV